MKKVIWIINQYASHLETRHLELARVFAEEGYHVLVVTSSYEHGKREYIFDEHIRLVQRGQGVTYAYLHANPPYKSNGVKRVLNMLSFCNEFNKHRKKLEDIYGIPGYIIASSAPPFVWEGVYPAVRKYNCAFIAEFRDIWPMSLIEVQGVSPSHPFVTLLSWIEKRAYKRADAIVSTMPHAWKHVCNVSDIPRENVYWMPNGINVDRVEKDLDNDLKLRKDIEDFLDEHTCCVYIGSITVSENPETIIKSFSKVSDERIWFAMIGDGSEKNRMIRLADDLGVKRIRFFQTVDYHLIPKILSRCSVAVAAGHDLPIYQYGLSINKMNDYLLSGIPVVFSSAVGGVVEEAGHYVVRPNDYEAMAKAIEEAYSCGSEERKNLSESGRNLIKSKYDYRIIGKNYIRMLESIDEKKRNISHRV